MADRLFRVACPTWGHVQVFCDPSLRHGRNLTLRLPFEMEPEESLNLELRLPNDLVVAVAASAVDTRAVDGGRWAVRLRLTGLDDRTVAGLERMMREAGELRAHDAEAIPPPIAPSAEGLEPGEESAFAELRAELEVLRTQPSAAALGLGAEPSADDIEAAVASRTLRLHPDSFRPSASPALRRMARLAMFELHRTRRALLDRCEGMRRPRAGAFLSAANIDDWHASAGSIPWRRAGTAESDPEPVPTAPSAPSALADRAGSEVFCPPHPSVPSPRQGREVSADEALAQVPVEEAIGDLDAGWLASARDKLAAAVRLDPRNRELRALYHVAYGRELVERGEAIAATTQFEAALAHDPNCARATRALAALRGDASEPSSPLWKRLFGGR